jgi:gas vesicle protein
MSDHDFGSDVTGAPRDTRRDTSRSTTDAIKDAASDAFTKASEMARQTGAKAKQAASDTTASVDEQVREMLDRQISNSWGFVGHLANSFKHAADDLDQEAPFAAGLVRSIADRVEAYAEEFQDQTVEQVMRSASDFARQQPALVFGLAAVAGFFVFRTMKNAQDNALTPSIAPEQSGTSGGSYG